MNKQQWEAFLNTPNHTDNEWSNAEIHSSSWACCAVGSAILNSTLDPKNELVHGLSNNIGMSLNDKAYTLGCDFDCCVLNKDAERALKIFNQIHELKSLTD